MRYQPSVTDSITAELRLIRQNVPGVRGSITATSDGLLVAHDMHGLEPTQVAARGGDGYLVVYAAGRPVIVAVLGTNELNVAMLNFQARRMIERIAEHSAGLARARRADSAVPAVPAVPAPAGQDDGPAGQDDEGPAGGGPLPARRRRRK